MPIIVLYYNDQTDLLKNDAAKLWLACESVFFFTEILFFVFISRNLKLTIEQTNERQAAILKKLKAISKSLTLQSSSDFDVSLTDEMFGSINFYINRSKSVKSSSSSSLRKSNSLPSLKSTPLLQRAKTLSKEEI